MPQHVRYYLRPYHLSVVEFDPNKEEIFLTVPSDQGDVPSHQGDVSSHQGDVPSHQGDSKLPRIIRDGMSAPRMEGLFAFPVTDPDGLRTDTPLICDAYRQVDLENIWNRLTKLKADDDESQARHNEWKALRDKWNRSPGEEDSQAILKQMIHVLRSSIAYMHGAGLLSDQVEEVLDRYVEQIPRVRAHDLEFHNGHEDYRIVGQQGCGDLTMNEWNVAFLNRPRLDERPWILYSDGEPVTHRRYTCLIKKRRQDGTGRIEMSIDLVRFIPHARARNDMVQIWDPRNSNWVAKADDIEFAVSNRQVIQDGELVDLSSITHKFSDLRCLFQLCNLNPEENLSSAGYIDPGRGKRLFFSEETENDVWFGEADLMSDVNLQRAAMKGPVFFDMRSKGLGAHPRHVEAALKKARYAEPKANSDALAQGEFRLIEEEDNRSVEVYLRRNKYSWTMIGLTEKCDQVLALACVGYPKKQIGPTVRDAAEELLKSGAHNALLIDAGQDVFQFADLGLGDHHEKVRMADDTELDVTVRPNRTRIRSSFIFANRHRKTT